MIGCGGVSAWAEDVGVANITIVSDGVRGNYEVLTKEGQYYLGVDAYPCITRYTKVDLSEVNAVRYVLGTKRVDFYCDENKLIVSNGYTSHQREYSGALVWENEIWLPVSEVLPWLNTNASVEKNTLTLWSDPYSYWELSQNFVQRFDIAEELGDDFAAGAALVALNVFDGFVNMRLEKLLPAPMSGNFSTESLFDYDCYVECFLEMATDDSLTTDAVSKAASQMKTIGKMQSSIEKLLDLDEVDPYRIYTYDEVWENLKLAGEVAKGVSTIASTLKLFELNLRAIPEQVDAVNFFAASLDGKNQSTMKLAATLLAWHNKYSRLGDCLFVR